MYDVFTLLFCQAPLVAAECPSSRQSVTGVYGDLQQEGIATSTSSAAAPSSRLSGTGVNADLRQEGTVTPPGWTDNAGFGGADWDQFFSPQPPPPPNQFTAIGPPVFPKQGN